MAYKKRQAPSFLRKTLEILCDSSQSDTICWSNDGFAFIIKDLAHFTEEVLPRYFNHSNFASYVRQLNMYGFHKCKQPEFSFYHPLFSRNSHCLVDIKRKCADKVRDELFDLGKYTLLYFKLKTEAKQLRADMSSLEEKNHQMLAELEKSKVREKGYGSALMMLETRLKSKEGALKDSSTDYFDAYEGLLALDDFLA